MKIGILAMQGDIEEHLSTLERIGVSGMRVKRPDQLDEVDGIIFPGGESTAMIKLIESNGLEVPLKKKIVEEGLPVYGTCAGMVLLSKKVVNYPQQKTLGFMDIEVKRNAFGRQIDSFEEDLSVYGWQGEPLKAFFIRAPLIQRTGSEVEILAKAKEAIVMAKQARMLVTSFHPELTEDTRVHAFFAGMVKDWLNTRS